MIEQVILPVTPRELLEETGYTSTDWRELGTFLVEPARQYAVAHLMVARNVRRVAAPRDDASERFEVELVPGAEVEVDGQMVYSKKATGKHGEPDAILASVRSLAP